ncbi:MAG: FtsB family cell division protein, partial [Chthoniobacterales bacterium]
LVAGTGYGELRARREATLWQQMTHILRVLLFIAVWLLIISFFLPPYKRLQQNRAEMEQLQAQLNEQQTLLVRQTKQVALLKTDPTCLETIARDNLELMKECETIFRLESRRPAPVARSQP